MVPQVPHRFHTGSTQFPHRFHTGSTEVPHRFHTGSTQVPDRFLGFNRGTVGIVEGVSFGNCPNYVLLNAPLRRTIFGMGGDVFLTGMPFTNRNHATGSTGSKQAPWVQSRHWFHSFQTGSLGSNTQWFHKSQTGSLPSTRHWFHRFQTGSLGSTTPLVPQVPHRFLGFNHAMGSTGSMQVPWVQPRHWFHRIPDRFFGLKHAMVPQVPDSFLGFNNATDSTGSRQVPWVHSWNCGNCGGCEFR